MLIAAVLVIAAALAFVLLRPAAPPAPQLATLAVLPFKPLTTEGRDDALELGMADSLIVRMSTLPGLVVRSIGSVRRFAGPEQDPLAAARRLDVQWILDGSVQRWGQHVRVSARLLKVADGSAAWSGSFDDDFKDVFSVQDRISEQVAQRLAPRLSSSDRDRMVHAGKRNSDAYQLYLTARYRAQAVRADGLRQSIALYQRAIAADPGYALAYAGLSDAWRRMAIGADLLPAQSLEPARRAAERALQLDPALAEAQVALGWVRWCYDWDWLGAEHSFRRALELNANSAEAHFGLGHLLCSQQRCDEGFAHVQRARELDPLSPILNVMEANYLRQRGAAEASRARLAHALEIEPHFWPAWQLMAGLEFSAGHADRAIQALHQAQAYADYSVQPQANHGAILAKSGQGEPARELLARLLATSRERYVPPTMVASLYCALGERGAALDWLERARVVRDIYLPFVSLCSFELRGEPRFEALRAALHLPAFGDGFCAPLQAPALACAPMTRR